MRKITKLHDKYSLYSKYGDSPCDRKPMTLEEALTMVRGNERLAPDERHCVYIVDNETDKMETAFLEEEFIDKCPEFWLFYEILGHPCDFENPLINALDFQADVIAHEWSTGAGYCANYFIGNAIRYTHMNNGQILYKIKAIMKELNECAESQIAQYEEIERMGQIVEVVEHMGLQVPRNYKYDEALVFEYAREKTNALRKLRNFKQSLLETYRKTCNIEGLILDVGRRGEKEFAEVSSAFRVQYAEMDKAARAMADAMKSHDKFIPPKSQETEFYEELDREMDEI